MHWLSTCRDWARGWHCHRRGPRWSRVCRRASMTRHIAGEEAEVSQDGSMRRNGTMLFVSLRNARSGVPLTPAQVTTPGVPDTGLIANGSNEFILLPTTQRGNSASQRRPALIVNRSEMRQSSCTYKPRYDAREGILSET